MKPILFNSGGRSVTPAGRLIRIMPFVALAAIAILAVAVVLASSRTSSEQEIKVRYDGQTYQAEGSSYQSSQSGVRYDNVAPQVSTESYIQADVDMAMPDTSEPNVGTAGDVQAPAHGRKVTYTYDYETETTDFDGFLSDLEYSLESAGGYMESSRVDRREHDRVGGGKRVTVRKGTYTLRVPADKVDTLVAVFSSEQSQVTYENVRMSDKTAAYIDAEAQAESYREEYRRLEALLQQAETVTETISIQDRLSNLNYQIQYAEKQMNLIDEDVLYATVSLTVYETVYYTASVPSYRYGFGEAMADAAEDFLYTIPAFLFTMVYVFVGGLVVVGLGAILTLAVMCIVNRRRKDRVVRLVDDRAGTEASDA